ncbi:sensor histidine kinase [Paenibacillus sp. GCM10023252]|uniref:cache domain-containing sensor histidine kinase n=1 Tax=Paenibacillus sp. GCM10023252 TaxID=3252649 RepID=UPI00360FD979
MKSVVSRLLPGSLKVRLLIALLLASFIPVAMIGGVSLHSIYSILENKVERGFVTTLEQERKGLENAFNNLDYASKQLAYYGDIRDSYNLYVGQSDPLVRAELERNVNRYMTIVNYTNPDLGLMTFYVPEDEQYIFPNMNIRTGVDIENHLLASRASYNLSFHGPHRTLYPYSDNQVLSVIRSIDQGSGDKKILVYIETNFKVFQNRLNEETYGVPVQHLLVDKDNVVLYSDNESSFGQGSQLAIPPSQHDGYVEYGDYLFFTSTSDLGWSLMTVVHKKDFNREMKLFLNKFYVIAAVSILISLALAWLIWKTIYSPLMWLRKHIHYTASSRFNEPIQVTGVHEFDDLLLKFQGMNTEISNLVAEVGRKERNKRKLEVEKLMYQINPHFIHNTLNTVQWMAKINNQQEIFKLITLFIEVMDYNLGKEGEIVTVQQELQALKDYINLQQIRYNHAFHVEYDTSEDVTSYPMPRFILQPIVENALYHGFKHKDGEIQVRIRQAANPHYFIIEVKDNGGGMEQEQVERLFSQNEDQAQKVGLGIGLRYVQNTLQVFYGEQYDLRVHSELGQGMTIEIQLPIRIKEDAYD